MARLWISAARPDQLVNVLAIAEALRGGYEACHFIHEGSPWWAQARWEEFRAVFESVTVVPRVATCRGLRDVRRMARELRGRQEVLFALAVQPRDLFVCVGGIFNLANAIASAFPAHPKALCTTRKNYVDASRPADFLRYRFTTSSALQYFFLHPRVGLEPTLRLKPWFPKGGDGVRLERPRRPLEEIYQAVILWTNEGTATAAPLPAAAESALRERIFLSPYPDLRNFAPALLQRSGENDAAPRARRRLLFFGTPFLTVRNLPPAQYAGTLNRCLDFLRRHYAATARLIYRPHPSENGEQALLRLEGFEIEDDREVAELYFLKHFAEIEAVFSVSSTVSRVAYCYGLPAYALWPCFPFNDTARGYFATLMEAVPAAFHLASLDQPPLPYAPSRPDSDSFRAGLLRALRRATLESGANATTANDPSARTR